MGTFWLVPPTLNDFVLTLRSKFGFRFSFGLGLRLGAGNSWSQVLTKTEEWASVCFIESCFCRCFAHLAVNNKAQPPSVISENVIHHLLGFIKVFSCCWPSFLLHSINSTRRNSLLFICWRTRRGWTFSFSWTDLELIFFIFSNYLLVTPRMHINTV